MVDFFIYMYYFFTNQTENLNHQMVLLQEFFVLENLLIKTQPSNNLLKVISKQSMKIIMVNNHMHLDYIQKNIIQKLNMIISNSQFS